MFKENKKYTEEEIKAIIITAGAKTTQKVIEDLTEDREEFDVQKHMMIMLLATAVTTTMIEILTGKEKK